MINNFSFDFVKKLTLIGLAFSMGSCKSRPPAAYPPSGANGNVAYSATASAPPPSTSSAPPPSTSSAPPPSTSSAPPLSTISTPSPMLSTSPSPSPSPSTTPSPSTSPSSTTMSASDPNPIVANSIAMTSIPDPELPYNSAPYPDFSGISTVIGGGSASTTPAVCDNIGTIDDINDSIGPFFMNWIEPIDPSTSLTNQFGFTITDWGSSMPPADPTLTWPNDTGDLSGDGGVSDGLTSSTPTSYPVSTTTTPATANADVVASPLLSPAPSSAPAPSAAPIPPPVVSDLPPANLALVIVNRAIEQTMFWNAKWMSAVWDGPTFIAHGGNNGQAFMKVQVAGPPNNGVPAYKSIAISDAKVKSALLKLVNNNLQLATTKGVFIGNCQGACSTTQANFASKYIIGQNFPAGTTFYLATGNVQPNLSGQFSVGPEPSGVQGAMVKLVVGVDGSTTTFRLSMADFNAAAGKTMQIPYVSTSKPSLGPTSLNGRVLTARLPPASLVASMQTPPTFSALKTPGLVNWAARLRSPPMVAAQGGTPMNMGGYGRFVGTAIGNLSSYWAVGNIVMMDRYVAQSLINTLNWDDFRLRAYAWGEAQGIVTPGESYEPFIGRALINNLYDQDVIDQALQQEKTWLIANEQAELNSSINTGGNTATGLTRYDPNGPDGILNPKALLIDQMAHQAFVAYLYGRFMQEKGWKPAFVYYERSRNCSNGFVAYRDMAETLPNGKKVFYMGGVPGQGLALSEYNYNAELMLRDQSSRVQSEDQTPLPDVDPNPFKNWKQIPIPSIYP